MTEQTIQEYGAKKGVDLLYLFLAILAVFGLGGIITLYFLLTLMGGDFLAVFSAIAQLMPN